MAQASPEHAVESAEDSGSDHSETQAGDAATEDLSVQSSATSRCKTQLSDTPVLRDNFILDSDGSETAFNPRLSNKSIPFNERKTVRRNFRQQRPFAMLSHCQLFSLTHRELVVHESVEELRSV